MPHSEEQLRDVNSFENLIHYLEEKLDWPLQEYGFDELTFEYQPAELGLKEEDAAKVKYIHQLRPLQNGQPWGIFFIEFENKKLPVVVLRRILSHLVIKKRASANKAKEAAWYTEDIMFITTFGEDDSTQREIAFAHFHQSPGDLPTLHVLGWDGGDTPLKLAHVDHQLRQYLAWPDDPMNINSWREQWSKPFCHRIGHIIRTADSLAEVLAALARGIRDKAMKMISVESSNGPLRQLHKAFQTALIHDLTEESFADTYAQTITYGLLTAAISRTEGSEGRHGTFIIAENVTDMVPITNPFLREMLQTFLKVGGRKGGIDFDELGIQDVVELLRGDETDLPAILRDFGNKTQGEDPVIHFYEHFLYAYNKKLKIQRGVFYTPQPVVSYIIRSVHELLKTEFGLEDGLASTITWGEMIARYPDIRLPVNTSKNPVKSDSKDVLLSPDVPFVMILDIATGTGTFLVEVIDIVNKTMKAKWQKEGKRESDITKLWNEYVPKYLLPRLYGYELMMAPYAIAHMKIGLKLFETGYQFESNERVRVYLTNTLEPPSDTQQQLVGILPALAHEAEAVNEIKRNIRFTVVVGNPPYSLMSANLGDAQRRLIDAYRFVDGIKIKERGALQLEKNLQDDYVKFIRLAEVICQGSPLSIMGYITNHAYIDNPSLRGLRRSLMNTFSSIWILDIHGNLKRKERCPLQIRDQNVFDIQQGVAIMLAVRQLSTKETSIWWSELWGSRINKYETLERKNFRSLLISPASSTPNQYFFIAQDSKLKTEFDAGLPLDRIFKVYSTGVATARDSLTVRMTPENVHETIQEFSTLEVEQARIRFALGPDTNDWKVVLAIDDIKHTKCNPKNICTYQYRPFDRRYTYYTGHPRGFLCNPRWPVMRSIINSRNIALCSVKTVETGDEYSHVFITNAISDHHCVSLKEVNYIFPVLTFPEDSDKGEQRGLFHHNREMPTHNFTPDLLSIVEKQLGCIVESKRPSSEMSINSCDILAYMYSILYSPMFRERYAAFLRKEFARIPFTKDKKLFNALVELGHELIALHLLMSPALNNFITAFTGKGDTFIPKKPTWKDSAVWINETQRFEGVPENVWNFHIGGYQVCEKWLKDRKGRTLSDEDIKHYQRIVAALKETIRIMERIDIVIDEHGGWPGAF